MISWTQKRRPFSAGSNRTRNNQRAKSPTVKKNKPKQEWNNYLTDNKYALTKEEVLKRQKLFVSKHNVLSAAYEPPPLTVRKTSKFTKPSDLSLASTLETQSDNPNQREDVTSLDLLGMSSDEEDHVQRHAGVQARGTPVRHPQVHITPRKQAATPKATAFVAPSTPSQRVQGKRIKSPAVKKNTVSSSSPTAPATPVNKHPSTKQSKAATPNSAPSSQDGEMQSIVSEVFVLVQELRMFEQATGKGSEAQMQELDDLVSQLTLSSPNPSSTPLLRLLTSLVCRSLTLLLEGQVQGSQLRDKVDLLTARCRELERDGAVSDMIKKNTSDKKVAHRNVGDVKDTLVDEDWKEDRDEKQSTLLSSSPLHSLDLLIEETKNVGKGLAPRSLSFLTPKKVEAGQEDESERWAPKELEEPVIGFTGTSATDFLFLPHTPNAGVTSATPVQAYSTPMLTPPVMSAVERAERTFDLYLQRGVGNREEKEEDMREDDEGEEYEEMVRRLSMNFTMKDRKTPVKEDKVAEGEQVSLSMFPSPHPPTPHTPPTHPLGMTSTIRGGMYASKPFTKKAVFLTKEPADPRVFDATLGSF